MKKRDDVEAMRKYVARISISTSAVRGGRYAKPGIKEKVRLFLSEKDVLKPFSKPERFNQELDRLTTSLTELFEKGHLPWGRARKLVNIFLRDATYNFYLRDAYGLYRIETLLEVPIDSIAAQFLSEQPEGSDLTKWMGVYKVTPQINEVFQLIAGKIAIRRGIGRHLLDVEAWGVRTS